METATEYRRFAQECRRLARDAQTERHRKIMEDMARAWDTLATQGDEEASHASPRPAFSSAPLSSPRPARRSQPCAMCNRVARAFGSWMTLAISKHSAA